MTVDNRFSDFDFLNDKHFNLLNSKSTAIQNIFLDNIFFPFNICLFYIVKIKLICIKFFLQCVVAKMDSVMR